MNGWQKIWIFITVIYFLMNAYFSASDDNFANVITVFALMFASIKFGLVRKIIKYMSTTKRKFDDAEAFLFGFGKFWLIFFIII